MAAVPIFVWNGTAWQETGPTIPANPIKYQASAPSSPSTGDIWVDSDGDVTTGSQQFQRFRFVASGGETTISGADANGAVLAYAAGLEQVVLNGAVLVRGHDYTATTGTTITGLSPALVASDVLEVFSFIAFTVANTYTQSQVDGLVNAARAASGLVLLTTQTFSGAGTVSLPNNTFTATYDRYLLSLDATLSTSAETRMRFRANGTDATGVNYDYYANAFTNVLNNQAIASGQTSAYVNGSSGRMVFQLNVYSPYIATDTLWNAYGNVAFTQTLASSGYHGLSNAYDSLTIFRSSGTMTGSISVYGYNK